MPADGGISATNKAGVKYGTGYCDAQCPRDIKVRLFDDILLNYN